MDSHNYGKANTNGQEQSLGSVPEEEESDWSEMGEETPRFTLTGSNRQTWRFQEGDLDKDSESGGDDFVPPHSPRAMQIPQLQFTIHNERLSDGLRGEATYRITTSSNLGSAMLIRSASLEEIPQARHKKELRNTGAMMDHRPRGDEAIEDLDNEIIHHWTGCGKLDVSIVRPIEAESSIAGLQSGERMISHFMCEPQLDGGSDQDRAEVHSWTGEVLEEVLKGERTEL